MNVSENFQEIPFITTEQMIEVDRAMMEDYQIGLIQMMENAGRNLAHLARVRFLAGDPIDKRITILAGTGGNVGAHWSVPGDNIVGEPKFRSWSPCPGKILNLPRHISWIL